MTPQFQEGFYDAVTTYVRTRSTDAFAADFEAAVSAGGARGVDPR
jgi:glucose/mannose transport system substrate-binding protein